MLWSGLYLFDSGCLVGPSADMVETRAFSIRRIKYAPMDFKENKEILRAFYAQKGLTANFEQDSQYLEEAFNKITEI